MSCGYQCHEIGGPYIAENPDCPIHGSEGLGDKMDDMAAVIRRLCDRLDDYVDPQDHVTVALLEHARNLASW